MEKYCFKFSEEYSIYVDADHPFYAGKEMIKIYLNDLNNGRLNAIKHLSVLKKCIDEFKQSGRPPNCKPVELNGKSISLIELNQPFDS